MPWPAGFPPWQEDILQSLSTNKELSGVNPLIIAGVEQAETGGWSGGAINPQGYGGYFGEGSHSKYGPYQITPDVLNTGGAGSNPSPATRGAYELQAQAAAWDFATELKRYGGNVDQAETAYQNGSFSGSYSGGVADVNQVLGTASPGNPAPGGSPNSSTTKSGGSTSSATKVTKYTGVAGILQELNDLMNPPSAGLVATITSLGTAGLEPAIVSLLTRALFSIGFLGLTYIGIKQLSGGSGTTVINQIQQGTKNDLAQSRIDVSRERIAATQANEQARAQRQSEASAARQKAAETTRTYKTTRTTNVNYNSTKKQSKAERQAAGSAATKTAEDLLV